MSNRPLVVIGTSAPAATTIPSFASDGAFESAKGSAGGDGDRYYNTTIEKYRFNENGVWVTVRTNRVLRTVTTTATILVTDELIFGTTASAHTSTLPTAVGCAGKEFEFVKTSDNFNAWTIEGNGAETVGGALNTTLNTLGEMLRIVSDGTNWVIVDRRIPGHSTAYVPELNSTSGVAANTARWVRIGELILIKGQITFNGAGASSDFTLKVPAGLAIDNTNYSVVLDDTLAGYSKWFDAGTAVVALIPHILDAERIAFFVEAGASIHQSDAFASGDQFSYTLILPITGWKG